MTQFKHILSIDLESVPGGDIFHIGAQLDGTHFRRRDISNVTRALAALDDFTQNADTLLGHNISRHDIPLIKAIYPQAKFLQLPIVDTLFLSPLAFPENPYHKLIKDYKQVKRSKNDPVADARLTLEIFQDQVNAFMDIQNKEPDQIKFFAFAFGLEPEKGNGMEGNLALFKGLAETIPTMETARKLFMSLAGETACPNALEDIWDTCRQNPDKRPGLAYLISWLQVAGGNSVLPPWVRHELPFMSDLIHQTRYACLDPQCEFCKKRHHAPSLLKDFFGFPAFRTQADGTPMQQDIVQAGLAGKSLFAILATGGGKSICYQIPALHRYRQLGELSVVISPLKALMQDQVDNLNQATGTDNAACIHGGLTLPERGAVMEKVRLGDTAILYISPEQLRNQSIARLIQTREMGYWIFDEAHCLSKWGHDFRPDYLHVTEFIAKVASKTGKSPLVSAFTATAKTDVKQEILDHFKSILNLNLTCFEGGVHRDNLELMVHPVTPSEKYDRIHHNLSQSLTERGGAAIVYCSSRKGTEDLARFLQDKNLLARAFHAGLPESDKRHIQEDFIAGKIPVICATNAFGMGIDKKDIRLVIHADIPGSLENYLQEAGRAGRDLQDSECILLYQPDDIDQQFSLCNRSKVSQKEIQKVLRLLRKRSKKNDRIVITPGEIMGNLGQAHGDETKARIAVSWLERKGFVQRKFNQTLFFKGRPAVKSMAAARKAMEELNLSTQTQAMYTKVLDMLFNARSDTVISADTICAALGEIEDLPTQFRDSRQVMALLSDMTRAGLIREGAIFTAFIRPKGKNNAPGMLDTFIQVEKTMLQIMGELSPEAGIDPDRAEIFHIRRMAQQLKDKGFNQITPDTVERLLRTLARDRGHSGGRSLKITGKKGLDQLILRVKFPWEKIKHRMALRHLAGQIVIKAIIDAMPSDRQSSTAELLTEFFMADLIKALAVPPPQLFEDETMTALARADHMALAESALLFLHGLSIITLQNGLGVFRQAFTLNMAPGSEKRRYSMGDYQALSHHYDQKNVQVHVMEKFARMGLEKQHALYTFIQDYFNFPFGRFTARYFPGEKKLIHTAMTAESYQAIIQSLDNPVQEAVAASPADKNLLVLAGPGSGKTRTLVHRCAWLVKAESVPPESILVLCFNHRAMLELRSRIRHLTGPGGRGITVMTFHGFAMRLTGRSFLENQGSDLDFDPIIDEAVALLTGNRDILGISPEDARDTCLAGFRHILVDEYQDIDQRQYAFVSALAGRLEQDADTRITLMAVGDDDQSIYKFRDANIRFIRRFQEDYKAKPIYLLDNYRSSHAIIQASNDFIAQNQDRMKTDQACRINAKRSHQILAPEQTPDTDKVQVVQVPDLQTQACFVADTIQSLVSEKPHLDYSDIAVISRTGQGFPSLVALRLALAKAGIPFSRSLKNHHGFPLFRIREIQHLLGILESRANDTLTPDQLKNLVLEDITPNNPWYTQMEEILNTWCRAGGDAPVTLSRAKEFFLELLLEERRDHRLGKGVFLGTVHSVKGMEFPVVFILDGGWRPQDIEEERRLFYVGMTRAEQGLYLIQTNNASPHIPFLAPNPYCRFSRITARPLPEYAPDITITTLGMKELYLSYPALFPPGNAVHRHLSKLSPGDRIRLIHQDGRIYITDTSGFRVAALSSQAARHWAPRLNTIINARVMGMVRRTREDGQSQETPDAYPHAKTESWEIPMVEILHHRSATPPAP